MHAHVYVHVHVYAAGALVHLLLGGARRLRFRQREDDRAGRVLGGVAQALPETGGWPLRALTPAARDVDRHDGRAHRKQLGEGSHGRARPDHDDVHALEGLAGAKVVGSPYEGVGCIRLDDAPLRRPRSNQIRSDRGVA